MQVSFWGAAQTVTGSMHLVETASGRILLDCGMFQGRRRDADAINRNIPFPASSIAAVILSHAHIDHSGNLPTLVKRGYGGRIHTTPPTVDLCAAMLKDTAHIQEKDFEFTKRRLAKRRISEAEAVPPLYTEEDASAALDRFDGVPYHEDKTVAPGVSYRTIDAGHMLGSTSVLLNADGKRLLFSGDIGRKNLPIIRDPEPAPPADYLIMESTYGDRFHNDQGRVRDKLCDVINRTAARGGRVIVPAFAVGRTQQLVLMLHELRLSECIPSIPIYVDSPLAIEVTGIFRKHKWYFDAETQLHLDDGRDPFGFRMLTYVREAAESKKLNDLHGPFVVISASGMCEAGRILHHLRNNISNPRNTVLITGFQAEHTLGRKIVDRQEEVNIFGEPVRLRAEVVTLNELSGHADQGEMLQWLEPVAPQVKKIFLVHGEPKQQEALAAAIRQKYSREVVIPKRGETFPLS